MDVKEIRAGNEERAERTTRLRWAGSVPTDFQQRVGAAGGPPGLRPLRFRNGSADPVVQCSLFCTVFDGINHPSKDHQTIVNQNKAAFSLVLSLFHS